MKKENVEKKPDIKDLAPPELDGSSEGLEVKLHTAGRGDTTVVASYSMLTLMRRPDQFKKWIASLRVNETAVHNDAYLEEGTSLLSELTLQRMDGDDPFQIREEYLPYIDALLTCIGCIVSGCPYASFREATGVSYGAFRSLCAGDRKGLKALMNAAMEERELRRRQHYADAMAERVDKGTLRPFVLRKGKDNDEIQMVNVKSDLLLAKAVESGAGSSQQSGGGGPTNIGNQINFIAPLPDVLAKRLKGAPQAIDVPTHD